LKIDQFTTNGDSSGMTADAANDKITVTSAGTYEISLSVSFYGTPDGYVGTIWINGSPAPDLRFSYNVISQQAGETVSASISGIATIGANQDVEFYVNTGGTTETFTVVDANLNVRSIGMW
jgi:hypothetical protein